MTFFGGALYIVGVWTAKFINFILESPVDDGESCSGGDSCGNTNITHISDTDSEVNNQHYLSCTKFMFPVHNQTLFINKNHLNMLLIHSPNICKCKKEI